MRLKSVVFCVVLSSFLGQNLSYLVDKTTTQSECENICAASTGQADFNPETKICKCLLSKHLDDVGLALFHKNTKLISDPKNQNKITKRETGDTITGETDPNIVGQVAPPRRGSQRGVPRRQREPRPISVEQQRIITQQITDHVNRLAQLSDPRLRDFEIDAIRSNLRQLVNTVLAPQTRSRLRNVEERRRPRPRLMPARVVGAPFPNFNEPSAEKQDQEVHDAKRQEVVTQDPTLIDG